MHGISGITNNYPQSSSSMSLGVMPVPNGGGLSRDRSSSSLSGSLQNFPDDPMGVNLPVSEISVGELDNMHMQQQ